VAAPIGSSILNAATAATTNAQLINSDHQYGCEYDDDAQNGFMYKYNEKTKKWKLYWFALRNQRDPSHVNYHRYHLFFYSLSEKQQKQHQRIGDVAVGDSKEKGFIELSSSLYYPVDDSFFDRSFCFQIILQASSNSSSSSSSSRKNNSSNTIVYYLSALNSQSFKVNKI